jgi:hypothetical protein
MALRVRDSLPQNIVRSLYLSAIPITATSPEALPLKTKRSFSTGKVVRNPSRLPSEPLHMTTRRAASKAATNSTAASVASGDSRRSSLADTAVHVGGVDIDSGRPTKKARLSDGSNTTSGSRRSAVRRRRTPSQEPAEPLELSASKTHVTLEPPRILEPRGSSSDNVVKKPIANGNYVNNDVGSERHLLSPFPKRRGRRPKTQTGTPAESANGTPAPTTPFNNSQQNNDTDRDPSRAAKRMPGRRRAPNPDASIEADLRRQLHLRLGYRAVAKALKPLLAELAQRTLKDVRTDAETVKESIEYKTVQAELDARLAQRLSHIDAEKRIRAANLDEQLIARNEVEQTKFVVCSPLFHPEAFAWLMTAERFQERPGGLSSSRAEQNT